MPVQDQPWTSIEEVLCGLGVPVGTLWKSCGGLVAILLAVCVMFNFGQSFAGCLVPAGISQGGRRTCEAAGSPGLHLVTFGIKTEGLV